MVPGERRHDRAEDDAADLDALDPAVREQAVDQQAEFVGRALAQRLQPPALDERLAVEDAEHDVGVADVNRWSIAVQRFKRGSAPRQLARDDALGSPANLHEQGAVTIDAGGDPRLLARGRRPRDGAPIALGARSRHASRIASNRPSSRSW